MFIKVYRQFHNSYIYHLFNSYVIVLTFWKYVFGKRVFKRRECLENVYGKRGNDWKTYVGKRV